MKLFSDYASFRQYPAIYAVSDANLNEYSCIPPLLEIAVCEKSYVEVFSFLLFVGKGCKRRRLDALSKVVGPNRHISYRKMDFIGLPSLTVH